MYREGNIKKEILRFQRFELALVEKNIHDRDLAIRLDKDYLDLSVIKQRVFPNTYEILEYLKPKYPLYILTNGFKETQFKKLNNCQLNSYFKQVFTSETIGCNKPHKKIFQWAVSSVNAKKKDCLMIGDDQEVDIHGANQFGMDSIFFNPQGVDITHPNTHMIKDLIEIKDLL